MKKTQDYFREFATIFFIQKNIFTACILLFTVGAILIAFLWPDTYMSQGSVILKRNKALKSPESLEDVRAQMVEVSEDDLFSEMQIITSTNVVENTIQSISTDSDFWHDNQNTVQERLLADKIQNNINVSLVPRSNVIQVQLTWDDPQKAEFILQTLFRRYMDYRNELYNPSEAEAFFANQLKKFNQNLRDKENQLLKLAQNSNSADAQEVIKSNLMVGDDLVRQLSELQNEWLQKKAYVDNLDKMLQASSMSFFTAIDDEAIKDMGKKLQDLLIEKEELLKLYDPQSKKVQRMQEQIESVHSSLKSEVRSYVDSQKAKLNGMAQSIQSVEDRLENLSKRNVHLFEDQIQIRRINRDIDILESSHSTFAKRLEEAKIYSSTQANEMFTAGILSQPRSSSSPVFPDPGRIIPLGFILGFIAGLTLAFLLEFFDHTFKRPEDVNNYTNIPHLFSIRQM